MLVTGTLTCLHCGHVRGEWCGERGGPYHAAGLREPGAVEPGSPPLRCGRCRGPLFLDGATAVRSAARLQRIARLRRQIAAIEQRQASRRKRAA